MSPGMFVRVRLPIGDKHPALEVIDRAITSDQGIKYVYIVDDENKVQSRPIKTGALQEDGLRVITEGLKGDEWVVVGASVSPAEDDRGEDPRAHADVKGGRAGSEKRVVPWGEGEEVGRHGRDELMRACRGRLLFPGRSRAECFRTILRRPATMLRRCCRCNRIRRRVSRSPALPIACSTRSRRQACEGFDQLPGAQRLVVADAVEAPIEQRVTDIPGVPHHGPD